MRASEARENPTYKVNYWVFQVLNWRMKIRVDSGHALESQKGSETRLVWKWKPKALSFIPRETCSIDFYEYLSLSLNNWIAFSGFTPSTVVELKDQKNCTTTLYISKALLSVCVGCAAGMAWQMHFPEIALHFSALLCCLHASPVLHFTLFSLFSGRLLPEYRPWVPKLAIQ